MLLPIRVGITSPGILDSQAQLLVHQSTDALYDCNITYLVFAKQRRTLLGKCAEDVQMRTVDRHYFLRRVPVCDRLLVLFMIRQACQPAGGI